MGEASNRLLVQTDVSSFPIRAQSERDRGFILPAPRQDLVRSRSLGEALENFEHFFGRPSEGRGVRRLFLNNVNANLDKAGYRRLADQFKRVMGKGGRVEIQWDATLEAKPGAGFKPPKGHRAIFTFE